VASGELGAGQLASMLALEGLTQVGADGRVLPRLAESWRWENNDLRLRVFLRKNVTFHDKTPLTAAVAADILRTIVAQARNHALYPSLAQIKDVRSDGALQLVLDLSDRSAFLLEDLSVLLEIGIEDVGTGPYRIVSRDKTEVVLERFNEYHAGRPAIARVVMRPFDTLRTTWTRLLRGEVDMVWDVADAVEFIRNDDVQVISVPRWYQFVIAFNSQRPPFQSPAVRKALNFAIDRSTLIDRVLRGSGSPSTGPIWPRNWAYDSSVVPYAFDPAHAASLLDDAGFPLPTTTDDPTRPTARLRFTCLIPENFSVWERIALEVQQDLFNIGVDIQFRVVPFEDFNRLVGEGRFDATLIDMISGPTPGRAYNFWRSAHNFKGYNVFGYENPEAERLFDVLRTSTNDAAVRSATHRLQRVLLDDPPALFLAWNERARAIHRSFVIPEDAGGDPFLTLWKWTRAGAPLAASTQ
jgi:peptide/nickel transport system substrate-binding protein